MRLTAVKSSFQRSRMQLRYLWNGYPGYALVKTSVYHFNDHILLCRSHFIIAGQTKPPLKKIHSHIHTNAGPVCIRPCPAVAIPGYKGIHPVNRLHMHRLPERTPLGIDAVHRIQHFHRAAFAAFLYINAFCFSHHLPAHRILVNQQAAEPEIGI